MQYKTKQRQILLEYLKSQSQKHHTVDEIEAHLKKQNIPVSRTTVYRYLESLTKDGLAKKYFVKNGLSTCYQYIGNTTENYHFVCSQCGNLIHVTCEHLNKLLEHLEIEHHFQLDKHKITFYGKCNHCRKEEKP